MLLLCLASDVALCQGHDGWKLAFTLRGHEAQVHSIAFSPSGELLITASDDVTSRIWRSSDGKNVAVLRGHSGPVKSASFSPDGKTILTSGDDSKVILWDAKDFIVKSEVTTSSQSGWDSRFSPTGDVFCTGGAPPVEVWNVRSPNGRLFKADGDRHVSLRGIFTSDGRKMLTIGYPSCRLWDISTGTVKEDIPAKAIKGEFCEKTGHVALIGKSSVEIWAVSPGKLQCRWETTKSDIGDFAWAPNGRSFAVSLDDGYSRIIDSLTGEVRVTLDRSLRRLSVRFSPDGSQIVGEGEKDVAMWDSASGALVSTLPGSFSHDEIDAMGNPFACFSSDGAMIANTSDEPHVWKVSR